MFILFRIDLFLHNIGVSEDVSNSTVTKSWFTSKKDKTDLAESGFLLFS